MDGILDINDTARAARAAGNPVEAADWFTTGAYYYLSREPFWDRPHDVFCHCRGLSRAAICYRLGDEPERARDRAEQGRLLVEEAIERLPEHFDSPLLPMYRGNLHEYLGDLQVYSGQSDDPSAYQRAINQYETATDVVDRDSIFLIDYEEQNDYSIQVFNEVVRVTDASVDEVYEFDDEMTHTEWVEYKQRHLPGLVDELLDLGVEAYAE